MNTATETRRRWWALMVLTLPVLIISMDATILGFAVPSLSETLEPSSSELLWIVDIYSFVLAGMLVTMGALGDRIGRRRLLMIGAAGFSVASVLAAFSTNPEMLIAARAMLGVAGATLMPSTLSLIRNVFADERERQTAIAIWASSFAFGSALGPIVGGFLLEHFWWGAVFLVGVPITTALLVVAPRLVPESSDPSPAPFDATSAALSLVTMLPTVYAVKMFTEHGLGPMVVGAAIVGVSAGVVFVRRQQRITDPMIDVSLFTVPRFRMAVSGNLIAAFGFAGSLFFVTQYLQLVVGMSPLRAGLQLLPAAGSSITFTLLAPVVARRLGAFSVIAGGLAMGSIGFAMLTQVSADGSLALTTAAVIVLNAGLGASMTVAVDGILAAIPPERAGAGASVSETAIEIGIALGTAVLGSIAAAVYRGGFADLDGVPDEAIDASRETLGAAIAIADSLGGDSADALRAAADSAFTDGFHAAALTASAAMVVVACWALVTRRRGPAAVAPAVVDAERVH
ncbi:MFS transporter [Ilumatobacter coccineus]|uniref:Drug resistance transporter n=1 Tax=Ilumatobacter coccineus (strain NBRC 103263 / KCTC 29153 / YM16-304) TaxID=1313172 RepID=A0A6C7E9Y6_ILUCY|nr:MFS transporter [Ilumatobacter coccineus]BAN03537.1 drug resistance transporter [Ilumatobacter coccineus YM16-304]